MCHRPSVSLNKEKVSREIRENKIAVCEKTQGLRSGNFSDLNSACSKVLVPVKIFQFHHMHYESERYRDAANGLSVKSALISDSIGKKFDPDCEQPLGKWMRTWKSVHS